MGAGAAISCVLPTYESTILRIYMPISAKVNGTRTLWQKLWGGSLTWYLAKKAKEFGVEQAVIQRVSGGYLKGKKLVSNLGEIIPDDLPMCIEMIDGEEKLRSFVGHYKDQLSGCRVVLFKSAQLVG